MQDSVAFESYPSHPLGARESWPVTGPIYGLPDDQDAAAAGRTFWQRLTSSDERQPESAFSNPSTAPIFY